MTSLRCFLFLSTALVAASCVDDVDPSELGADATAPVDDATTYTQTSVHRGADGSLSVEQRTITAGEQRAQIAAREAAARGGAQPLDFEVHATCAPSDFWLFDQPNLTGNQLCVAPGPHPASGEWQVPVPLGDLSRAFSCPPTGGTCLHLTWALAAGSFYAGADEVLLGSVPVTWVWAAPYSHRSFSFTDPEQVGKMAFIHF